MTQIPNLRNAHALALSEAGIWRRLAATLRGDGFPERDVQRVMVRAACKINEAVALRLGFATPTQDHEEG